jgi:hypothetical protein
MFDPEFAGRFVQDSESIQISRDVWCRNPRFAGHFVPRSRFRGTFRARLRDHLNSNSAKNRGTFGAAIQSLWDVWCRDPEFAGRLVQKIQSLRDVWCSDPEFAGRLVQAKLSVILRLILWNLGLEGVEKGIWICRRSSLEDLLFRRSSLGRSRMRVISNFEIRNHAHALSEEKQSIQNSRDISCKVLNRSRICGTFRAGNLDLTHFMKFIPWKLRAAIQNSRDVSCKPQVDTWIMRSRIRGTFRAR